MAHDGQRGLVWPEVLKARTSPVNGAYGGVAVRPLAEHIDRLEFNSMTGVAIAVAYWRRRWAGR